MKVNDWAETVEDYNNRHKDDDKEEEQNDTKQPEFTQPDSSQSTTS